MLAATTDVSHNNFCVTLVLSLLCLQAVHHVKAKPSKSPEESNSNGFLEGDMLVNPSTWRLMTNQTGGSKRSAVTNGVQLWPGAVVPYIVDSQLGDAARKAIVGAMRELELNTCVSFIPRTTETSYVYFILGGGCYSYVGRTGRGQVLSIGKGCETTGIALHELLHALGFFHTSSRTDRDAYVIVDLNNVTSGKEINFRKYSHGQIDSFGTPYDINSIMHLSRDAFAKAKNSYTIVARAGPSIVFGQRQTLSPVDIYQVNALYNCGSKSSCLTALGLQSGKITNTALIASSSRSSMYSASQARLHNHPNVHGNGAWCPDSRQGSKPWLQVYLGWQLVRVTAIATQGLPSYLNQFYTTTYEIEYWKSNYYYRSKYQSSPKSAYGFTTRLPGNWDLTSVQYNALTPTFYARYVRISPRTWVTTPCIRIEIYGCKV